MKDYIFGNVNMVAAIFRLRKERICKRRLVVAIFKLRCSPQAKASKRRLKPAATVSNLITEVEEKSED